MKAWLTLWIAFHHQSLKLNDKVWAIKYHGETYSMVISNETKTNELIQSYLKEARR